jgi:hypothetical protein
LKIFQGLVEGVNSSLAYLIHCKNLWKCHNTPPTQHNNKGKKLKYNKIKDSEKRKYVFGEMMGEENDFASSDI